MRSHIGFLIALLLAAACGSNSNNGGSVEAGKENGGGGPVTAALKLNGAEYTVLSGAPISTESQVSGVGTLVFKAPRLGDDSNYELSFLLPVAGASLTLTTNASEQLKNGVNMTFSRTDAGKLKVLLVTSQDSLDLSEQFEALDAQGQLTLPVDVHQHGDFIVDLPGGDLAGEEFVFRPSGHSWGLTLDRAVVTKAAAGNAKHAH